MREEQTLFSSLVCLQGIPQEAEKFNYREELKLHIKTNAYDKQKKNIERKMIAEKRSISSKVHRKTYRSQTAEIVPRKPLGPAKLAKPLTRRNSDNTKENTIINRKPSPPTGCKARPLLSPMPPDKRGLPSRGNEKRLLSGRDKVTNNLQMKNYPTARSHAVSRTSLERKSGDNDTTITEKKLLSDFNKQSSDEHTKKNGHLILPAVATNYKNIHRTTSPIFEETEDMNDDNNIHGCNGDNDYNEDNLNGDNHRHFGECIPTREQLSPSSGHRSSGHSSGSDVTEDTLSMIEDEIPFQEKIDRFLRSMEDLNIQNCEGFL